jgi:hypothetical protein
MSLPPATFTALLSPDLVRRDVDARLSAEEEWIQ